MLYWAVTLLFPPGVVAKLPDHGAAALPMLARSLYFSIVTMTTLGFGDMHAAKNVLGYLLRTIQVLLGYVLLGALVTRFAVLFQAGGPAAKYAKKAKKGIERSEYMKDQ